MLASGVGFDIMISQHNDSGDAHDHSSTSKPSSEHYPPERECPEYQFASVGGMVFSPQAGVCRHEPVGWSEPVASIERGTCTAIWSPSKSALNAVQTSG